jgi:hypothetical protein
MFNTPFATNGFQGQSFPGFQGFNGFNNWNSWNNTPWSSNSWNSTPWNWNANSFGGSFGNSFPWNQSFNGFQGQSFPGFQGQGFQGQNFSPWSQPFAGWNQWSPFNAWNWFNSPAAFAQFGSQFGSQFGNQFGSPFGFNWWNNESAQSETGTPNFGAPFANNPFAGFNPANNPANQAA